MWATVCALLCLAVQFYCYFIHVYFLLVLTNKRIQIWIIHVDEYLLTQDIIEILLEQIIRLNRYILKFKVHFLKEHAVWH